MTAAVVTLVAGLIQINPVWLYGPYVPYVATVPAQPDWYVGWLEGALRLGLPIEPTILGVTIPSPFVPGVLIPGLLVTALAVWPFLEARLTHDHVEHHLLDPPWRTPIRTATGAAGVALFLVLTLAGGNDVLADPDRRARGRPDHGVPGAARRGPGGHVARGLPARQGSPRSSGGPRPRERAAGPDRGRRFHGGRGVTGRLPTTGRRRRRASATGAWGGVDPAGRRRARGRRLPAGPEDHAGRGHREPLRRVPRSGDRGRGDRVGAGDDRDPPRAAAPDRRTGPDPRRTCASRPCGR